MSTTAGGKLAGGPIRVLLVDDEVTEMEATFIRGLAQLGWDLHACATVIEARERLESWPPYDVVIADMVMAEGADSGLQVIEAARAVDAALRIIVLTARGTPATAFASGRRGVRAYVDKLDPVNDPEDQIAFLVPILAKECRRIREIRGELDRGALDADAIRATLEMAREARGRFSTDLDRLTEAAERGRFEAAIGSGREAEAACDELLMYLEYFVSEFLSIEENVDGE